MPAACQTVLKRRVYALLALFASATANAGEPGHERTISLDLGHGAKLEMVLIPSGSFLMGDAEGLADEKPPHKITITRPFYLGKYEVTQAQWAAVIGNNPSNFKGPQHPVESVGWVDCRAFLERLNQQFAGRGLKFDLPSEAQWEYACRAGGQGKFSFGDDASHLGDYAWFQGNSGETTHAVGMKQPNAWGLFDMHGNVSEWCADWYNEGYYRQSPAADPAGATSSYHRVIRGGSWSDAAANCRASYRNINDPSDRNRNVGLRVIGAVKSSP